METKPTKPARQGRDITLKALVVVGMALLLLIPQAMIQGLIRERADRSEEAVSQIENKWSGAQTVCGPLLHIPYTIRWKDGDTEHGTLTVAPATLDIEAELWPEQRHLGIYQAVVYRSEVALRGTFPAVDGLLDPQATYDWHRAYLSLRLGDLRGLRDDVRLALDGDTLTAEAGNGLIYLYEISTQPLVMQLGGADPDMRGRETAFECRLTLNGSEEINFVPVGRTTHATVAGQWDAPGFGGGFSPDYELRDGRFTASWSVLHFNRNIPDTWTAGDEPSFDASTLGVKLVSPVDHYQQSERSAKYAIMFIGLTFVVFFFVELLTGRRIHPVQYLLVGAALILFYSLLLSLSEHIGFGWAYLVAAVATVALITAYASSIFRRRTHTGILCALLCALYAFLYTVLQLEDVALLIGSVGLFAFLAIVMYVSRKVEWYKA